jgi:predicted alpha/beta-fold hydrolase
VTRFNPLFKNPHLATISASLVKRDLDERRFPVEAKLFQPELGVQILIHRQRPEDEPLGHVVLVHGLEGSSNSVYMRSLAQVLLEAGYAVHRMNIRTCGGTEFLCNTFYHAGLTTDIFAYLMDLDRRRQTPAWLVGFSLGGNMVLKLAGEMKEDAQRVIAGVCAVSAPVDLRACAKRLAKPLNFIYQWHFLRSMKKRLELRQGLLGEAGKPLKKRFRSVYEFDDVVTGPAFGFDGADHYYQTQSAARFAHDIRVPALVIAAEDDPLIPSDVYEPLEDNPLIRVVLTPHGGHLGFLAKGQPRFWLDGVITRWIASPKSMEQGGRAARI